jgi:hypothetical protein
VDLQLRVGLNTGQLIPVEIGSGTLGYTSSVSNSVSPSGWNRRHRPRSPAYRSVLHVQTVPQNYGAYIVPSSTLDQAMILVSQWNTTTSNPYNVQQFVVNLNR